MSQLEAQPEGSPLIVGKTHSLTQLSAEGRPTRSAADYSVAAELVGEAVEELGFDNVRQIDTAAQIIGYFNHKARVVAGSNQQASETTSLKPPSWLDRIFTTRRWKQYFESREVLGDETSPSYPSETGYRVYSVDNIEAYQPSGNPFLVRDDTGVSIKIDEKIEDTSITFHFYKDSKERRRFMLKVWHIKSYYIDSDNRKRPDWELVDVALPPIFKRGDHWVSIIAFQKGTEGSVMWDQVRMTDNDKVFELTPMKPIAASVETKP